MRKHYFGLKRGGVRAKGKTGSVMTGGGAWEGVRLSSKSGKGGYLSQKKKRGRKKNIHGCGGNVFWRKDI